MQLEASSGRSGSLLLMLQINYPAQALEQQDSAVQRRLFNFSSIQHRQPTSLQMITTQISSVSVFIHFLTRESSCLIYEGTYFSFASAFPCNYIDVAFFFFKFLFLKIFRVIFDLIPLLLQYYCFTIDLGSNTERERGNFRFS